MFRQKYFCLVTARYLDEIISENPEIREMVNKRLSESERVEALDTMEDHPVPEPSHAFHKIEPGIREWLEKISDKVNNGCTDPIQLKPMFDELEMFVAHVPNAVTQCKTRLGESALNLAVRAGLMLFVEKYINREDNFQIIRQRDRMGKNSLEWCQFLVESGPNNKREEYEEILEFLNDHDPGVTDDDGDLGKEVIWY